MPRLWVMRSPHDIALEFIAQDLSVASLCTSGHRLPDIRKSLMTIEAAQLDHFSIQLKSVICKLRLSKTEPPGIFVQNLSASQHLDAHRPKVPISEVPPLHCWQ